MPATTLLPMAIYTYAAGAILGFKALGASIVLCSYQWLSRGQAGSVAIQFIAAAEAMEFIVARLRLGLEDVYMLGCHLASLPCQRRRGLATGCLPLASHYVPPGLLFLPSVARAPLRRTRSGGAKGRNGGCGVVA